MSLTRLISRKGFLIKAWEQIADKVPSDGSHSIFLRCLGLYWFLASPYHFLQINWREKTNLACDLQREHLRCLPFSSHLIIYPPGQCLELQNRSLEERCFTLLDCFDINHNHKWITSVETRKINGLMLWDNVNEPNSKTNRKLDFIAMLAALVGCILAQLCFELNPSMLS